MNKNSEQIGIDLKGRINSLKLAERNSLYPLFEAIVNSIQAIQDAASSCGKIDVFIMRENTIHFETNDQSLAPIENLKITDNGIGFDEKNYKSFKKAYSTHKVERGCKGIGRFIWLKAFTDVAIDSIFLDNGLIMNRKFNFNIYNEDGITTSEPSIIEKHTDRRTIIELRGYKEPYKSKCPKKISTIANRIIEHCMIYFLDEKCPKIVIADDENEINLNEKFNKLVSNNLFVEKFQINNIQFELHLIKWFEHDELTYNKISLCANQREVEEFNVNKIFSDVTGKIEDENSNKPYLILGYISSKYFDENINDERTEILFRRDDLFDSELISRTDLYEAIKPIIQKHFEKVVENFKEKKLQILEKYITEKAPHYRMLDKLPEVLESIIVSDNSSEEEIDLKLYKAFQDYEFESRKDISFLINCSTIQDDDPEQVREKYLKVLHNIGTFNKSKLAQYVVHRKYIIELFEKSLELNAKGKYELEKIVHDIVYPTKKDSNEVLYEDQNLWLIDERLSFHTYLTSDKALSSIEGLDSNSALRPDLLIFNNPFPFVEGEDFPFNSIILVEFKRPMRDKYDPEKDNPIEQIYDYVEEIRKRKKLTRRGRNYPINESTLFYTYLICDINDKIDRAAKIAQLTKTFDGLGYYGYNKDFNCMIEIIPFEQVLSNAKKRNKILFNKLGI